MADSKGEDRIAGPLGTDGGWTKTVVGLGHYCDSCQKRAINRVYQKDGKVRHYSCQAKARAASMSDLEKIEAMRRIFDVFPEDDMPDVFEGYGECTCYDDGVMCVTPKDCPTHGPARVSR